MSSVEQLKDLSPTLAAELAADLIPSDQIFAKHGMTMEQGFQLMTLGWFRDMVDEAKKEWSSLKSSKQRLRLKGQLALEEAIPEIYRLIHDSDIPGAARVAAFKELINVSGMAAAETGASGATGLPSVTIYLGSPGTQGSSVTIQGATSNAPSQVEEAEVLPGLEILDKQNIFNELEG
jgi:hypothetical protein